MHATNMTIEELLSDAERGIIRLPRFQRKPVWRPEITERFLEAVMRKHPVGVLLVLEVDSNDEPFHTRPISGMAEGKQGCRQHLLDGQQRLTAFVQALRGDSEDTKAYYVKFAKHSDGRYLTEGIVRRAKSAPWHGKPDREYDEGLLPMRLLEPGDAGRSRSNKWRRDVEGAKGWEDDEGLGLDNLISDLRETFSNTSIPCLAIRQGTTPEDAIDIFTNFNTSSVRLTAFDIANAICEKNVNESLQDYVDQVEKARPKLAELEGEGNLGDLVLKVACMDQDLRPTAGSYRRLDFAKFLGRQKFFLDGLEWTEQWAIQEGVWDPRWLPSTVPFRVLPLLRPVFQKCKRDRRDRAVRLVRCYMWRAFLTGWYSKHANDRLRKDYLALREMLAGECKIPANRRGTVFDEKENSLPTIDDIREVDWPKRNAKAVLKQAILAVCVKRGAMGIETGERIEMTNSEARDYHHVYPKALLGKDGDADLVVNCMLLEPEANRSWKDRWPGDYLAQRLKDTGGNAKARKTIVQRLETHALPAEHLLAARGEDGEHPDPHESYREFQQARAQLILTGMTTLYDGKEYR